MRARRGWPGDVFAAVDVCYPGAGGARAAVVTADNPLFAGALTERAVFVSRVLPYRPGQFFLRELPPVRAALTGAGRLALVVIDGYVDLDPGGRPGLGAHVHAETGVPVIGVAKSAFRTATHAVPVTRGRSSRPLFVTAAGITREDAASVVRQMAGRFRLPDALRRADMVARRGPAAGTAAVRGRPRPA